ncbi:MAG: hypothetical protein ACRDSH_25785 [Pseudonocardiaceae bacterium]
MPRSAAGWARTGASVAALAREFGIGLATTMAAVREHGTPRVQDSVFPAVERADAVRAPDLV